MLSHLCIVLYLSLSIHKHLGRKIDCSCLAGGTQTPVQKLSPSFCALPFSDINFESTCLSISRQGEKTIFHVWQVAHKLPSRQCIPTFTQSRHQLCLPFQRICYSSTTHISIRSRKGLSVHILCSCDHPCLQSNAHIMSD